MIGHNFLQDMKNAMVRPRRTSTDSNDEKIVGEVSQEELQQKTIESTISPIQQNQTRNNFTAKIVDELSGDFNENITEMGFQVGTGNKTAPSF